MGENKKEAKNAFDVYLSGERLEKLETPSGIPVKEVYTPDDIQGLDYERFIRRDNTLIPGGSMRACTAAGSGPSPATDRVWHTGRDE